MTRVFYAMKSRKLSLRIYSRIMCMIEGHSWRGVNARAGGGIFCISCGRREVSD